MRSEQLEHVLRAAADILQESDLIVIGSAAILGTYRDADLPLEATRSNEADVIPWNDPTGEKADRIDGAIGEGSMFHGTYGYYAQGVDRSTAQLPSGWEERLVQIDVGGITPARGYCLEKHDLAVSKLIAAREKDHEFVESLLTRGLLDRRTLLDRLRTVSPIDVPATRISQVTKWLSSRR